MFEYFNYVGIYVVIFKFFILLIYVIILFRFLLEMKEGRNRRRLSLARARDASRPVVAKRRATLRHFSLLSLADPFLRRQRIFRGESPILSVHISLLGSFKDQLAGRNF